MDGNGKEYRKPAAGSLSAYDDIKKRQQEREK